MTDLTKIEKPFGLLSSEEQNALDLAKIEGKPLQIYDRRGWVDLTVEDYLITNAAVVRQKPQPPKPREVWVNHHRSPHSPMVHETAESADKAAFGNWFEETVHYREVMEGEQ